MIKLITSDIDGTLLEDGGAGLSSEFFEVILKLRKKGIQFAAASGRQYSSVVSVFEPVKDKIFYISDNGAYIGCYGRNLYLETIDKNVIHELIYDVRNNPGLEVIVSGPDIIYAETKNSQMIDWMVNGYQFKVKQVEDLTKVEDDFIKVSVYKSVNVEEAAKHLREKYQDRLKITIAGDMWMDCMRSGVSKGKAVELLQDSLNIRPEETMSFGDQLNDLEMMEQAYYSFAVGNARREIKKIANFQTDSNVNQGVLKILKLLL